MTTLLVALAVWALLSLPIALLLARLFRGLKSPSDPVSSPGDEGARPGLEPGRATNVPNGDATA